MNGEEKGLVQSLAVPKPDSSASAVVVSGGKQYRVAPGDRILVDRLAAEPGASVKLGVLLFSDGGEIKVGNPAIDGLDVDAKVIAHRRGPRIESLRYKSKKRVRVHSGGRAHLTALEIIAIGGIGVATEEEEAKEEAKLGRRGRVKAAPKKKTKAEATKAEAVTEQAPVEETPTEDEVKAPEKKPARRRAKKESE